MEWVRHILYEYDLTLLDVEAKGNHVWKVQTNRGMFRLSRQTESEEQLVFAGGWLRRLRQSGIRRVIPYGITKYGESVVSVADGRYVLQPWIQPVCSVRDVPGWERQVMRQLGQIHQVSAAAAQEASTPGLAPSVVRKRWLDGMNAVRELAHQYVRHQKGGAFGLLVCESESYVMSMVERAIERLERAISDMSADGEIPHVLCHGRLRSGYVLATGQNRRQLYLTGFERAGYDGAVRDLTVCVRHCGEDAGWNVRLGRRWLGAYEAERQLSETERQLLSCYLLYPEPMMRVAKNCLETAEVDQSETARWAHIWRRQLTRLFDMQQFAFEIIEK
ncbi:spore coat protein YsxE [Aneurinibacillus soli]|uniref:Phosphotransferase enzyme family protein n=1 Tax=Aneurinibacillus soli TaxID=1500254 RepID=A0A0U5BFM8_9BACL|nr:phosphotransferase [Aneurinibacillus soli]PYE62411.1 spore coat protein YsxE [Aneurinibacillus soli]BAU26974.1 Phosphotransferase enzyme family protein [Aneurinibacillus soli]